MVGPAASLRATSTPMGWLQKTLGPVAAAAQAEAPELLEVEPADNTTVSVAPVEVRLEFSEPVLALLSGSTLNDATGAEVPVRITVDNARTTVRLLILSELAAGEYQVSWEVRSDGDITASGLTSFAFDPQQPEVTPTVPAPDRADEPTRSYGGVTAIARFLGWLLAASAVGVFVFLAVAQRGGLDEMRRLVIMLRRLGLLLIVVSLVEILVLSVRSGARVGAALDWDVLTDVLASASGFALVLRAFGGLILALGSYEAAKPIDPVVDTSFLEPGVDPRSLAPRDAVRLHVVRVPVAIVGSVLLLISMVVLSSSDGSSRGPLAYLALAAHQVAAALWLGVGVALLSVCGLRIDKGRSLRRGLVMVSAARMAGGALIVLALSGVVALVDRLDGLGDLLSTGLGRSYLVKVAISAIAGVLLVQLNARAGSGGLMPVGASRRAPDSMVAGWRGQVVLATAAAVIGVVAALLLT